jgi:hypothetical protein
VALVKKAAGAFEAASLMGKTTDVPWRRQNASQSDLRYGLRTGKHTLHSGFSELSMSWSESRLSSALFRQAPSEHRAETRLQKQSFDSALANL